ncbi:MAG: class II glutamine amidotransferase [Ignisphaera sp.]
MCRIALYASAEDVKYIKHISRCFKLSSLNDFVLDRYRRGRRTHTHGWGYAYIYSSFGELGLSLYKTSLPIAVDGITKPLIPNHFDWILMILHSRLTTEEPIDVLNSHPYYFHKPGKVSIWLAHNGALDKEKLAKDLGMENLVRRYSDSYFLTQWLGENISSTDLKSIVGVVKETINRILDLGALRSALNFVTIVLDEIEKKALGLSVNYVAEDYMNLFEYYTLYKVGIGSKTYTIASSTVALYLNELYGFKVEPIDNHTIILIHPGKENIEVEVHKF